MQVFLVFILGHHLSNRLIKRTDADRKFARSDSKPTENRKSERAGKLSKSRTYAQSKSRWAFQNFGQISCSVLRPDKSFSYFHSEATFQTCNCFSFSNRLRHVETALWPRGPRFVSCYWFLYKPLVGYQMWVEARGFWKCQDGLCWELIHRSLDRGAWSSFDFYHLFPVWIWNFNWSPR